MKEGLWALLAFVIAWFVTQMLKTILGLISHKNDGKVTNVWTAIDYFTRSGGMPSGHTASFTALCVVLGCTSGFDSAIFALAVATWSIIVYDAVHVRYAVGEQGKALNKLLKQAGEPVLPVVEGHTVPQVIVGGIIGIIVGFGLYLVVF